MEPKTEDRLGAEALVWLLDNPFYTSRQICERILKEEPQFLAEACHQLYGVIREAVKLLNEGTGHTSLTTVEALLILQRKNGETTCKE